jgi:heme-degrading monooxygenase HmoA
MSRPLPNSTASKPLIARVWRGATPAARRDEYLAYVERTGTRDCRATPGNRGVEVLHRVAGDRAEFVFISYWESMEVIKAFAGADVTRARYYPEDRSFLYELTPTVEHYEVTRG